MSKIINSHSLKKKNKCSDLFTPYNLFLLKNFTHELRANVKVYCETKFKYPTHYKNDIIDMIVQVKSDIFCNLVSQIHISFSKNSSFAMYYDSKTF